MPAVTKRPQRPPPARKSRKRANPVDAKPPAADPDAWKREIEAVLKQIPGYNPWDQAEGVGAWLDHEAARDAINWFAENLKHVEGSARGDPFVLRGWQAAIVGNTFGWKRKDVEGRIVRRYREVFLLVARGNGKTPLAAGITLRAFFEDHEPGAQCYLAAGAREQAGFLFRNAQGMVNQNEDLKRAVKIYAGDQHRSLVLNDDPLSFVKVIPADAAGQHGGIPHVSVVDELHVQPDRELVEVFRTAMSKKTRKQPLLVMITTADYDRISICNEIYDHAVRVRDNGGDKTKTGYDPAFLPVLYEVPDDADWTDETVWHKANPNIDVSVEREGLRAGCLKAQETPTYENTFRRLHLNQRTKQEMRLIPMDAWRKCAGKLGVRDLETAMEGRSCYGGLDLSSCEDLSSFSLVFPMPEQTWVTLNWSWCPADKVIRRARQKIPYDVWRDMGFLDATAGDQIDYSAIRQKLDELKERYDIKEIGYDPYGAAQLAQDLQRDYGDDFVINIAQTHLNLSGPTKEIVRRAKLGKIVHGGNPVLEWAASNVAAYLKGRIPTGAEIVDYLDKVPVMASKQNSADKIDPFAAMVDAVARLLQYPEDMEESVYGGRGARQL